MQWMTYSSSYRAEKDGGKYEMAPPVRTSEIVRNRPQNNKILPTTLSLTFRSFQAENPQTAKPIKVNRIWNAPYAGGGSIGQDIDSKKESNIFIVSFSVSQSKAIVPQSFSYDNTVRQFLIKLK